MPSVIARIHSLDSGGAGIREHRNKYGPGITPVYDQDGQVLEIRFSDLSEPDAREWLQSHGYQGYELEGDGSHPQEHTGKRHLTVELSPTSDLQEVDGGLLVPGVVLLAPGTWTDSTQKTPCRYTEEKLERYHANWEDFSYWSRHGGGVPRDITDRIADIRNLRYDGGVKADLFYNGVTSKSQDAIAIVKAAAAGKVPWPFSSVEMMTRDKWIVSEKLYEAQEITFFGAAMVNQGACRVCRIRNNEWVQDPERDPINKKKEQQAAAGSMEETQSVLQTAITEKFGKTGQGMEKYGAWIIATFADHCIFRAPDDVAYDVTYTINEDGSIALGEPVEVEVIYQQKKQQEAEMPDIKELEAENAKLKKELEEARKPQDPVKLEIPKELTDSITALVNDNKELKEKIKALEEDGQTRTSGNHQTELEEPINNHILVDKQTGTIRGV